MGMPVAPVVPIHQPPLVDDDFTREFRRGIDRVAEAMEGLGDGESETGIPSLMMSRKR